MASTLANQTPKYPAWTKVLAHILGILGVLAAGVTGFVVGATSTPTGTLYIVWGAGFILMAIVGLIAGATFKPKTKLKGKYDGKKWKVDGEWGGKFEGFAPWAWIVLGVILLGMIIASFVL